MYVCHLSRCTVVELLFVTRMFSQVICSAYKCLQHVLKCRLFHGIKGLHLFSDVVNYTVTVHYFALPGLYFVCRLNTPVIVDCWEDGDFSCSFLFVFFLSQLGKLYRMIML